MIELFDAKDRSPNPRLVELLEGGLAELKRNDV